MFVKPDIADLRRRWTSLLGDLGLTDDGLLDELLGRYGEPHRRYLGVAHVEHVVRQVDELSRQVGLDPPHAALLAAWFHDAVYDPKASDNERRSADLAAASLRRRAADPELIAHVDTLIMASAAHVPADDDDLASAVLLDADLAILSAPTEVYDRYAAAIREEYAFVPDEAFRTGRRRVLESLAAQPTLYRTAPMRAAEPQARANLARELRSLGA